MDIDKQNVSLGVMEKITSLAKRRGFIFQGSEIYGGYQGFWDYGPAGVEMKNNIKKEWWKYMVSEQENVVGIDAAIIMNPKVWEKSGHLKAFTDPLVECKVCNKRFREDSEDSISEHEKTHKDEKDIWTKAKTFNLMTEVLLGTTEPKEKSYLRGEITQGAFVNFKNVVDSNRVKIPFGIAQIGKAFRNEITPGNLTFRSREFEQMELEYFVKPSDGESKETFEYFKEMRKKWYESLGIDPKKLRFHDHEPDKIAHYARYATDLEYEAPFGWSEFEGIHHRGDYDLKNHGLTYKDNLTGEEFTPWVIETSGGVDRAMLFFLIDAYTEDGERVYLKLNPRISPYKVAVFPLLANKPELLSKARDVYKDLKANFNVVWDDRGNIGKRYFAQDEIGTPWCVTVDFESLDDNTVTVRDRDTASQERIAIDNLSEYFQNRLRK
ncbi:MAG: glycyl-tRNA synthetase, glycyl-tRNA synthetase [Microgenomates group bacterium GW2011_GWC1_41_20]|uniref:Glycine-tRNA ligase n=6 Tax=Candidatus Woeseibacteriota TaxID=1752722 RepID=A0A0G0QJH5_9BACT|nr:MAG: Glycine-tRNA ligase [Candidatus Woesebacteria bacterium GW2011_GWB1_40_12]KKR89527.1 MAG: Glycine-tRNA ligase [Candidatus Woesebacteria bacterium GW2011_GWD1_41_12]KKS00268.1 MAG: glycyl-tRNA synthetase, glycyl-tRNA synthetase [Microgenomates group bacterium GW2011_GWC1_41_20]KKS03248.1 MAG: Glycine-tRNA ligase [Candidatus Woesebacteria bacterium GW2011_GWE1_41_24]KKS16052.1 MAG: Glycine-tRNA ligase [Candidatus Woesebacteria bacterium GW2011_GWA1_41_7]OGM81018.1 MAG: glycine--tRNA liga